MQAINSLNSFVYRLDTYLVHFSFVTQRMFTRRSRINSGRHFFQTINVLLVDYNVISFPFWSHSTGHILAVKG
jgi:hypothetical protein